MSGVTEIAALAGSVGAGGPVFTVDAIADQDVSTAVTLGLTATTTTGTVTYAWEAYGARTSSDLAATVLDDATAAAPVCTFTDQSGDIAGIWVFVCALTDDNGTTRAVQAMELGRDNFILHKDLDITAEASADIKVAGTWTDTVGTGSGTVWTPNDTGDASAWDITNGTGHVVVTSASGSVSLFTTWQSIIADYTLGDELFVCIQRVTGSLQNNGSGSVRYANPTNDQFAVGASETSGGGIFARSVDDSGVSNYEVAGSEPAWAGMRVWNGAAEFYHKTTAGTWPPIHTDLTENREASLDFPVLTGSEWDASTDRLTITSQGASGQTETTEKLCIWRRGR